MPASILKENHPKPSPLPTCEATTAATTTPECTTLLVGVGCLRRFRRSIGGVETRDELRELYEAFRKLLLLLLLDWLSSIAAAELLVLTAAAVELITALEEDGIKAADDDTVDALNRLLADTIVMLWLDIAAAVVVLPLVSRELMSGLGSRLGILDTLTFSSNSFLI